MIKALPTRVLMAVPREFIPTYVQHGQAVCEAMYGKRATLRYVRTVGRLKLKRLRRGETAVSDATDGGKALS